MTAAHEARHGCSSTSSFRLRRLAAWLKHPTRSVTVQRSRTVSGRPCSVGNPSSSYPNAAHDSGADENRGQDVPNCAQITDDHSDNPSDFQAPEVGICSSSNLRCSHAYVCTPRHASDRRHIAIRLSQRRTAATSRGLPETAAPTRASIGDVPGARIDRRSLGVSVAAAALCHHE